MSERLRGLRLWITRPEPASRRSARRFEREGASCTLEATVSLQASGLERPELDRLRAFLPGARLLLSSSNAARFLVDALEVDSELRRALLATPASVVGESTANYAYSLGLCVDHVASISLGLQLARELVERGTTSRVVLPGSDRRLPEAELFLRDNGVEVLPLCVYRTIPASSLSRLLADSLRAGQLDATLVYSPSAVSGIVAGARDCGLESSHLPPCLALGSTTASEVEKQGLSLAAVPSEPGEEALVESVVQWWSAKRAHP